MKKSLLIGVLAAAVLATSLSGCGSESTSALEDYLQDIADVSDTDDEAEDAKDEDSEQEAEASEDDTADEDDAVVVSDEAYIERLEAYQEYYNSIKDEDEDYEVLATISLDEDNLPIMWLMFADKDKLIKKSDTIAPFSNVEGYVQVCDYNKEVVVLAETPRFLESFNPWVIATNTVLGVRFPSDDNVTWYDEDTRGFVEPIDFDDCYVSNPDLFAWTHDELRGIGYHIIYGWDGSTIDNVIYYGSYTGMWNHNSDDFNYYSEILPQDMFEFNAYWWDGSLVTTEKELAVFLEGKERGIIGIAFEDSDDFNILVVGLISEPVYDVGMIALKSTYGRFYDVEYADLDNMDELFEDVVNRYCEIYDCYYDEAIESMNQKYGWNLQ